jgi:hypothetical protein
MWSYCGLAAPGNLMVVFLVIEAVLFGLFTCCMMLDQWTVVSTNTTSESLLVSSGHTLLFDVLSPHAMSLSHLARKSSPERWRPCGMCCCAGIDRLQGEFHAVRTDVNEVSRRGTPCHLLMTRYIPPWDRVS